MIRELDSSGSNLIDPDKPIFKMPMQIGPHTTVVIHQSIVEKLGINQDTLFEEKLTDDGILLRIVNKQDYSNCKRAEE